MSSRGQRHVYDVPHFDEYYFVRGLVAPIDVGSLDLGGGNVLFKESPAFQPAQQTALPRAAVAPNHHAQVVVRAATLDLARHLGGEGSIIVPSCRRYRAAAGRSRRCS
jgi:hypothetical protein